MAARHVLTILAVRSLPRAAAFYRAAFGWPSPVEAPVYVEFTLPGDQRLGLYAQEGYTRVVGRPPALVPEGRVGGTELYLHVDDLGAAVRQLEAAGATLLSPATPRDWGDTAAYFADPEGNVLVVAQPTA